MTIATLPPARHRDRVRAWAEGAARFGGERRELWPAAAIVAATLVIYHLTLGSFVDYLRLETPLAYLPLLPLLSLGLALFVAHRHRHAPTVRDRHMDLIVSGPILLVAVALITVVPSVASTFYWTNRPDVLSMAFFVVGAVVLGYGVNWAWRLRAPLAFLLLMWPALYLHVMAGLMQSFTTATNNVLALFVHRLLGVTVVPIANDSPQLIVHPAHLAPVSISVGSACSGADSVLGFLLLGGALLTAMRGGISRKLLWIVAGLAVTFVANIVRITSIVALAGAGHADFAINTFHTWIGLILFAAVMLLMALLLRPFGLRLKGDVPANDTTPPAPRHRSPLRRGALFASVCGATALLALADHSLATYAAFDDGYGAPTVQAFGAAASAPPGFRVEANGTYPWARQYFGPNSTFTRYLVLGSSAQLTYADVVVTDDRGSLDAYNLQNCYLFHNYDIVTTDHVDLGSGVTGLLLNYSDPASRARWATVSWAWPITKDGRAYYERIVLTSNLDARGDADVSPSGGVHDFFLSLANMIQGSRNDPKAAAAYHSADQVLRAQANLLVGQAIHTARG
ncbi:MAG TPA: exosortase/archaeosortase family protein [Candidatus Dormibacteraeota bacterium]|jgi:exosortase|nr:exosortase/archaeosortase family protein [Candidatus Dormibacteraeota bacterium]